MRFLVMSALVSLGLSVVGCGGASTGPKVTPPTPEETKEIQAMHDQKAKEAGQPANAPGGSGAPNQ